MDGKSAQNEPLRYNNEELRIVMVGKTGAGKSGSGNTILGRTYFKSRFSSISLTEHCAKAFGEVDGQTVAVIDSPGLFDSRKDEETTKKDLVQCISYASPGPHVFLVIIKLGRLGKIKIPIKYQNESLIYNNEELRIVMVGKTGVGKSATGNTILGKKDFKSRFSPKSLTTDCAKAFGEVDGQKVAVIDTPGLFDTRKDEGKTVQDLVQCINYSSPGPHIFLVIIKLGRFTDEEKQTVERIQKIFGDEADRYSMVPFTHGDLLKGEPMEEFLAESEELQELVRRCNGQYHVFDNELEDHSQVRELIKKIREINQKNGGSHYTTEMFQAVEREIEKEKQRILREKEEERRKELERIEMEIKKIYARELLKAKADIVETKRLMAAREREMEQERREMQRQADKKARQEAEKKRKGKGCCIL